MKQSIKLWTVILSRREGDEQRITVNAKTRKGATAKAVKELRTIFNCRGPVTEIGCERI
jgi:hypothetical protein